MDPAPFPKGTISRMKAALFLAALALAGCGAPGSSAGTIPADTTGGLRTTNDILGGAPSAKMKVMLYDAPLAGMSGVQVNIGIDGLQLVTTLGTVVPFVTNKKPDVVNLLDLQDHSEDFDGAAPFGTYSAVRMLIDSASSNVKVGNMTIPIVWGTPGHPVVAPSVAVDFPCTFVVTGLLGPPPNISMDFNVLHSVKFVNGVIYVQPSVTAASNAAQISGKVQNRAGKPVATAAVLVVDALGHVVNSTATASDGTYTIHALPAGAFSVQVKNSYVTAVGDTITAVGADAGAAPSASVILTPNQNANLPTFVD
jgi:hypothetical protein